MQSTKDGTARELTVSTDAEIDEEPRTDLVGLVQYFTSLRQAGIRVSEVTYVINRWTLGGFIPMTHHGFVFKTAAGEFFTLDFGRKGISWDVMDEMPGMPDNTFFTKLYRLDVDTYPIQKYCEDSPPFNYPFYDCETWSKGLLEKLDLAQSEPRKIKEACTPSVESTIAPKAPVKNVRRQRTGACV